MNIEISKKKVISWWGSPTQLTKYLPAKNFDHVQHCKIDMQIFPTKYLSIP